MQLLLFTSSLTYYFYKTAIIIITETVTSSFSIPFTLLDKLTNGAREAFLWHSKEPTISTVTAENKVTLFVCMFI